MKRRLVSLIKENVNSVSEGSGDLTEQSGCGQGRLSTNPRHDSGALYGGVPRSDLKKKGLDVNATLQPPQTALEYHTNAGKTQKISAEHALKTPAMEFL